MGLLVRIPDSDAGVCRDRLRGVCHRGVDLRLEIRGALHARREGGGTPADAPSDEEGEGAGRIDCPRGCCCRQARSNGIGHPRCLTLDIDLRACKREKHQGPSPSEPHQGEPATEQEPRLRAR